ncbi:hypothetical protein BME99_15745 [Pseudomonas protegens]|nr:hypothetical protein BME99_15745 [Pseudomonas protegens]
MNSTYAGIDAARGLAVVNQDLALHRKLLADFRDSQQQVIERLWQAHAAGDLAALGFLAHSLQGNAGTSVPRRSKRPLDNWRNRRAGRQRWGR